MEEKTIVFLDLHGVLETARSSAHHVFDERAVSKLRRVLEETNALVVITANERLFPSFHSIQEELRRRGVLIYGVTPCIPYASRNAEIQEWIDDAPYQKGITVTNYVIVDDVDVGFPATRFVQTHYADGLTEQLANKIILLLKGGL